MERFRTHLNYSNVMATIAVFVALGGGAYAVTIPRNSVGENQLKPSAVTTKKLKRAAITSEKLRSRSVTAAKIKDRTVTEKDLEMGLLPSLVAAKASDADPPPTPGTVIAQTTIITTRAGSVQVFAPLRGIFSSCSVDGSCSTRWGVYVDNKPVPGGGVLLQAEADDGDGFEFHLLFGATAAPVPPGAHTVKLARTTAGSVASAGELSAQLGALAVD